MSDATDRPRRGGVVALAALAALALGGCEGEPPPAPATTRELAGENEAFRGHVQEFRQAYQGGNYVAALAAARAALEIEPRADEPWVWVSSLYSTMGQEGQGAEYFGSLTERFPELPRPWFYRGRHLLRSNELEDALAAFDRAAALDPDDADALYWRGIILHGMGDAEAAADAYREASRLAPSSSRNVTMLARALRETGQYDEAARVVEDAVARFADSAELHTLRGQLRLRTTDYPAAEASLRRAIELDPRLREAHEALAVVLLRTGRESEAADVEATASRLMDYEVGKQNMQPHLVNARDPAVPMLLAELELTERNFDEAIRWYTRAIALGLQTPRTLAGRAEALFGAGRVDAGDADLAAVGDAGDPRVALARAARAVAVGDDDAARAALADAVDRGPTEREFLRRAADLWARIGDAERARELLRKAAAAPRTSSEPGS